ncbi:c-type cytochrome [Flavobacterium psychrophilum]|uniref:c-type cytochrome n=1 Tax=Flavobacterium psychrophilum TaxID=96345 RepID=UPI000A3B5A10|nr:c-type cytochrome [Flavobacterium psychrophilum]EKT4490795.1 c-type cytochrome [Flavobacterium psychrophilum]OUD29071.1 cytochrome C552 [Flavobacterium psychrophilum]QZK99281.1 c-type cytochrome [Flavobacterium psychrophilum]SNB00566.1 Cytochrome c551/c552 family protein [Flavobacterium psychrophilum]
MKKIIIIAVATLAFSCKKESEESFGKTEEKTETTTTEAKSPSDLGKEIFEGKGTCTTCHKPDVKTIGPSIQDIAKIYKEKNANIITFLKGKADPIVDPTQYEVMKANFALIKTFSDEELQQLEAYVYSNVK